MDDRLGVAERRRGTLRRTLIISVATMVVAMVLVVPAVAAETAREILDRRATLERGARWWQDRYQRMSLVVRDPGGTERRREIDLAEKRTPDLQQKSLIVFRSPVDRAGLALLALTEPGAAAAQWMYIPELRQIRQIGGKVRFSRFDITDFTPHDLDLLADMTFWSEADAGSTLEGSEEIDGVPCYRVALAPHREYVKYAKIVLWIGYEDLVFRQLEFFETASSRGFFSWLFGGSSATSEGPVRRFRQWDIRWINGVPVAYRAEAESVERGSTTKIEVIEVRINEGLDDTMFNPARLDRISN